MVHNRTILSFFLEFLSRFRLSQGRAGFFFLFGMFSFSHCFGSIGNANRERAETLINLIGIVREEKVSFTPRMLFYDSQSDSTIDQFVVRSGGTDHTVQIVSGSFTLKEVRFRVNPPTVPFASPFPSVQSKESEETEGSKTLAAGIAKTHTPFTVPLNLPSDNPYGRVYTFALNQSKSNFFIANDGDLTGDYHLWTLGSSNQFPQGLVSSAEIEWTRLDLVVTITNGTTRTYTIRLEGKTEKILPRCRIELNRGRENFISFGFRYSSLFRDIVESGVTTTVTAGLFALPTNSVISDLINQTQYNQLQKNLSLIDNVWTQHSCLF